MFRNYLKTAYRNLLRSKIFTAINIAGFAVGICAVILILHYVQFHFSFDDFHKYKDTIYRIGIKVENKGEIKTDTYIFTPPIGAAMKKDFPEVVRYTTLREPRNARFTYNNSACIIENVAYADTNFLKMFSYNLTSGNIDNCLTGPYQIVLTKTNAGRIFGKDNPIGKILKTADGAEFSITGIVEDPPKNSGLQFGALASFATLYTDSRNSMGWNGGNQYVSYVQLHNENLQKTLESKFPPFMWDNINNIIAGAGVKLYAYLQPLSDIHLKYSDFSQNLKTNIYIFSFIAGLILFLACINFINLFNSRSIRRNREIGMRKVLGARRIDIVKQFLSEALLLIIISTIIAVILCALALPLYNRFTHQDFTFSGIMSFNLFVSTSFIVIVTAALASFYPAVVLSSFQPVQIMKKYVSNNPRGFQLKSVLVAFQFTISITLIIVTLLINHQLDFLKSKDTGFKKDNQLVIPLISEKMANQCESIKSELLKINGAVNASGVSEVPSKGFTSNGYFPEGVSTAMMINVLDADADFFNTYDVPIIKGHGFFTDGTDGNDDYIINEAFARKMNWPDPIGKTVERNGKHTIIGVVKDFNYASLHDFIEPLIITNKPWNDQFSFITLHINTTDPAALLNSVKKVYSGFSDGQPLNYFFIDEMFNEAFQDETIFREMFFWFSLLAISIALLGILGLTLFAVEQKKKEIAIRKIHGAAVHNIMLLISGQFVGWIAAANLIAFPAAYLFFNNWLNNFAYKDNISVIYFIKGALLVFITAILIITLNTIKASLNNPVNTIKYE